MQVGAQPVVTRGVTVPHTAAEHAVVPCVRVQVAPWLLASLLTVAVNGVLFNAVVAFTGMSALAGEMEIVMASTVIAMAPVWAISETEVATIVTPKSLAGGVVGAV